MSTIEDPIIRPKNITQWTGLGRSTVYRMIAAGEFPAPKKLTAGAVGWPRSCINAWRLSRGLTAC